MKTIGYDFKDNRYYQDGQEIDAIKVKQLLSSAQYNWLHKTGHVNVRKHKDQIEVVKPTKHKQSPDERLYHKHKDEYKVEHTKYKNGAEIRIELWRKNKKYGYYNFAAYLQDGSEEEVYQAIIADVKNQEQLNKVKKNKVVDDDLI